MPTLVRGSVRKEYCPSHVHVEWDISYESLRNRSHDMISYAFKVEKQSYAFHLECDGEWLFGVQLSLIWMGPPDNGRSLTGRCWVGLKCSDGTNHHRTVDRKLSLKFLRESWTPTNVCHYLSFSDLEREHVTSDGRLTFFFRMDVDRAPAGTETCTHGLPQLPSLVAGSIREEECSSHKHVEWDVGYEEPPLEDEVHLSPAFDIGTRVYFFESRYERGGDVLITLYTFGRSVDGPAAAVQYWFGLKCADGTFHQKNYSHTLDLRDDFGLWTRAVLLKSFCRSELKDQYLTWNKRLTFFFRVNVGSTGAETCTHGTSRMPAGVAGSVREEQCSSHKHVEWEVRYERPQQEEDCRTSSPAFKVGAQVYYLSFCNCAGHMIIELDRVGSSVSGAASSVRCWVGIKRPDGTYPHKNDSKTFSLREEFSLWTDISPVPAFLHYVARSDFQEEYLTPDKRLTFFVRMNVEPTGAEMCTHGPAVVPPPVSGRIREEQCPSHKHVEWEVPYAVPVGEEINSASPVFKIGDQAYFFDLCVASNGSASLSVYRFGRSVARSARCWAGPKRRDGTYHLVNFSESLDLREEFGLWTRFVQTAYFDRSELIDQYQEFGRLLFFFRMNVEPTGAEKCTHGPAERTSPEGEGGIREEACPSHKHVQWDIAYKSPGEDGRISTSPVFEVDHQCYLLNLCYDFKGLVRLRLYRSGPSDEGPVRCWAGLKRGDGFYHHQIQGAQLDLREECSLWTEVASFLFPHRSDVERGHLTSDGLLTFFLQVNRACSPAAEETCAHSAGKMCAPGEGRLLERDWRHVDWEVGLEAPQEYAHLSTSPVFRIGDQSYLLELCYETDGILGLSLYRSGRPVEGRVRCWAGLRLDQGTYHHRIEGVEHDLRTDCELWTKAAALGYFCRSVLEKQRETSDGVLTFFFLMNAEARGSNGSVDVAAQTDGNELNIKDGHVDENRTKENEKLRQQFRLWLQNSEEGDRIRRLPGGDFEAEGGEILKIRSADEQPDIFAA